LWTTRRVVDEVSKPLPGDFRARAEDRENAADVQKSGCPTRLEPRYRPIAAPAPLARPTTETGLDRVSREIPSELDQVPVPFDLAGIEAALEEVSLKGVSMVEVLRITAVQPLHAPRKIAGRSLDDEVVVVRHEAVAVANPPSCACKLLEHR